MAQKDKVKELVGRGLDSYHTKALQQIDRINKKNKEQNHKISILTNELDNDYLTKTEEGSVISLEHSKEGMVYLDELQGNTLVNYCTDGSKEITLNGDIDVEGVDNVYNVIIKPNTLYTVALDTNKTGTIRINLGGAEVTTTNNVAMITTPETLTDNSLKLYGTNIKCSKVRLLEGDKTNWIPSYFEGMKSSFEDKLQDDGTYKMEISSNNKNLCPVNRYEGLVDYSTETMNSVNKVIFHNIPIDQNKRYVLKGGTNCGYLIAFATKHKVDKNISSHNSLYREVVQLGGYGIQVHKDNIIPQGYNYISITTGGSFPSSQAEIGSKYIADNIMLCTVDENNYEPHKSNKIQFSSIEPLRGVGNIKDRFMFKDGKLMIERNCKTERIDTSIMGSITRYNNGSNDTEHTMLFSLKKTNSDRKHGEVNYVCNIIPTVSSSLTNGAYTILSNKYESIWLHNLEVNKNYHYIRINKSRLNTLDIEGFEEWLSENHVELTYQLEEPIYEEVPFELQKLILEGYENGTLFFDTNIPPTSTITYAGETPIVKSAKLNRAEVESNTTDINDNIIPYLCDMDYRIVVLELQQGQPIQADFYKLFGGVYEMLKRDILSKRLSKSEYGYRLIDYFNVGKLTEQQVRELEDLINE